MFELTKEQEMLRTMVREFAEREIAPKVLEFDRKSEIPAEITKKMASLGIFGITTPREYGGSGMGQLASMIAMEELSRVYPSIGFFLQSHLGPIYGVSHFGSEDQKRKYLPPIMRGEKVIAFAVTEATGGSELSNLGTEAVVSGEDYIINGRKIYITDAAVASLCLVMAKTGERASVIMVEKGTAGFTVGRRQDQTGMRLVDVGELAFNDCRVPRANVVGKEGSGVSMALNIFTAESRPGVGAVGLGIARGAFEIALKFAKERVLYGKPIASLQMIQQLLTEMDTEIDAARWLVYYPAAALDKGIPPRDITKQSARAKVAGCEVGFNVTRKAIEILGGNGVSPEYRLSGFLNDVLELYPADGTLQIMRVIQASEILK